MGFILDLSVMAWNHKDFFELISESILAQCWNLMGFTLKSLRYGMES